MEQQLYVKNEKGRYVPYIEPEPPFDNVLYRKVKHGRKTMYVPQSMCSDRGLDEGVWVVIKNCYGKSYASGKYLYDCFLCMKASDIQDVELAKLGGMENLASFLSAHWEEIPKTNTSIHDFCRAIVGMLFKYKPNDGK
jgi:hypothetical protein